MFPEVFLGGYRKGESFGAPVGMRKPEGRYSFRRYHDGTIDLARPEVALVAEACAGGRRDANKNVKWLPG